MKKNVLFVFALFVVSFSTVYSQIAVTSYSIYALGVNTSKDKKISGELKVFSNRYLEETCFEISGLFNLPKKDYYQFSLGLGFNTVPFISNFANALTFPMQMEVYPLQSLKQLSFVIEFAPEWCFDDLMTTRHLWGVRYTF